MSSKIIGYLDYEYPSSYKDYETKCLHMKVRAFNGMGSCRSRYAEYEKREDNKGE